ncbi:MAG: hypothetical protein V4574_21820 [Pseudomonadota bacterium]
MRRLSLPILAATLAVAPAASAETLCDSLKAIVADMPSTRIVPEGWVRCAHDTTGAYLCHAAGGRPQATVLAHLAALNAEIARCYGLPAPDPVENPHAFVIATGDPAITIATTIEGAGTPEGGIRLRIAFAHPS